MTLKVKEGGRVGQAKPGLCNGSQIETTMWLDSLEEAMWPPKEGDLESD